ncbi:hypothetical protein P261_01285 [Lachnospiraceae bacterium TWA4]|nr:hypothetical protein P261_01285 [Lachnospiraceae bacterium TWA4]
MKTTINMTAYSDDTDRYESAEDLRSFYKKFGCFGLELMPAYDMKPDPKIVEHDMIVGVHCRCLIDWIDLSLEELVKHYKSDLDYAKEVGAEYVVFHISQTTYKENLIGRYSHTDEEIVDACCKLINALLDEQDYSFYFLMENLWYSGLTFKDPYIPIRLLNGVHYKKKGFMLDTGHYMNTNTTLRTPYDGLNSLYEMLEKNKTIIPFIKGLHLHQSLSGEYVENFRKNLPLLEDDIEKLMAQAFEHVFKLDEHKPFAIPEVRELVKYINPDYVTYEYITRSREENEEFLKLGSAPLVDL